MDLKDLKVYQIAMEIGEKVWNIVNEWEFFPKNNIGNQWVKSADSIAANISEGYGRYHFKEKKNFSYFARGSLFETTTWLDKAKNRNLIGEGDYNELASEIKNLGVKLNNYINSIGTKTDQFLPTNDRMTIE